VVLVCSPLVAGWSIDCVVVVDTVTRGFAAPL
jgi:hypothetical protein